MLREHDHVGDDDVPKVGIVVVNYLRSDLTVRCLESLHRLTWPADRLAIALVDNGSAPGELDEIRQRFPEVRVVEAGSNVGFGGACNRGFAVLDDCTHLALVNNDAVPEPDWLGPLVDVLEADPTIGAAVPKILLAGRFVSVEVSSPAIRPGGGDGRPLGVQLCGARVDGDDVIGRTQLVSGFWGWEHDAVTVGGTFAWTDGAGVCRLPVPATAAEPHVELSLACGLGPTKVELRAGTADTIADVDIRPEWVDVGRLTGAVELVNSTGLELLVDASTADRGYMQPDGSVYDVGDEVFGWSGAAVLLSRAFLDDVGGFDEPFFLYYEDADLSWRGRARGWSYRYEPAAVVRHDHSATIGERSAMARHLLKRNRLLTLVKNAPTPVLRRALTSEVRALVSAVAHDVVGRVAHGRGPVMRHAADEARVLVGVLRMLPSALHHRRSTPPERRVGVWADWAEPA